MEAREWKYREDFDVTAWGSGPWDDEPDKGQWTDEATGLPCLFVRNNSGALCGYVGVSKGHSWFEKGYNDCRTADDDWPEVHGGLTFSDKCQPRVGNAERGICHVVSDGEDGNVWWLGFDCAHSGDKTPATRRFESGWEPVTYRNVAYVKGECADLAKQAKAVA